ncbi:uncharacterized protein LOC111699301 [Eurytemora carolleeae]|uniref:uncharacterized protein LOC111699301 n=1 Tax=Eurytemora carolleeae TaxID=1294199 RepID=UPI000C762578|nr:uncharacterized protein LOC111699301 [Eurytemora carolleeae]|eukprot:XP_023325709.1 uncharacterized protein LOC111699301 [Eurytemora affinis]
MAALVAKQIRQKDYQKKEEENAGSTTNPETILQLNQAPIQSVQGVSGATPQDPPPEQVKQGILLYTGLGMISIGLIITCVGIGDKGFSTIQLKLMGPALVGSGLTLALIRILLCTYPSLCYPCKLNNVISEKITVNNKQGKKP